LFVLYFIFIFAVLNNEYKDPAGLSVET